MKKEVKNNGEYFECDADNIVDNLEKIEKCDILVITKGRIELAGDDKKVIVNKIKKQIESGSSSVNKITSDIIFRGLML